MQITQTNDAGYIHAATNDGGTIQYLPIGNDRIVINGRDAWRGEYLNADGKCTGQFVEEALWVEACELVNQVDAHNRKNLEDAREAAFAKDDARVNSLDKAMAGTRGTYTDENTF